MSLWQALMELRATRPERQISQLKPFELSDEQVFATDEMAGDGPTDCFVCVPSPADRDCDRWATA